MSFELRPPSRRDHERCRAGQLASYRGTRAGRILVEEWGDEAGRKLATALYRWDRMIADMTETEEAEIDDFYLRRLRPQERAAVLRRLAA